MPPVRRDDSHAAGRVQCGGRGGFTWLPRRIASSNRNIRQNGSVQK
ncbi:MAG: hypothetical protein OJF61_001546 [Rhodanobacteraceae bacterium]|nr:MAG: hypothetical protein OJF61_001546 [Rhodanobacteraceae bacterium]